MIWQQLLTSISRNVRDINFKITLDPETTRVWTVWVHLCVDFFFHLTHAIQTHVVWGSAGNWESEYVEGQLRLYVDFQLCEQLVPAPMLCCSWVNCNCSVPLLFVNLLSVLVWHYSITFFSPQLTPIRFSYNRWMSGGVTYITPVLKCWFSFSSWWASFRATFRTLKFGKIFRNGDLLADWQRLGPYTAIADSQVYLLWLHQQNGLWKCWRWEGPEEINKAVGAVVIPLPFILSPFNSHLGHRENLLNVVKWFDCQCSWLAVR